MHKELSNIEKLDLDAVLNILRYLSDSDINRLSSTSKKMHKNILDNKKIWNLKLKEKNIHILDERMSNKTAYVYAKKQILTLKKLTSLKETYKDYVNHKREYQSHLNLFSIFGGSFANNSFFHSVPGDDLIRFIDKVNGMKEDYESDLNKLVAQGYVCSSDEKTSVDNLEVRNYKKKLAAQFCRFEEITFKNKLDKNTLNGLVKSQYPSEWLQIWYSSSYSSNVDRVKALLLNYNRTGLLKFFDYFTRHHTQKILDLAGFLDKNPRLTDKELVTFLIQNAAFGSINLEGRFANMLQFIFDNLDKTVNEVLHGNDSENTLEVSKLT